jgi:hypothetical protein
MTAIIIFFKYFISHSLALDCPSGKVLILSLNVCIFANFSAVSGWLQVLFSLGLGLERTVEEAMGPMLVEHCLELRFCRFPLIDPGLSPSRDGRWKCCRRCVPLFAH